MRRYQIAVLTLVMGLGVIPAAQAQTRFSFFIGRDDHGRRGYPILEGRRYQEMRALAHDLDERAQHALEQAEESAHHGDRREGRFLDAVEHFARRTEEFHERMDRYAEAPWDVNDDVVHLIRDARNVSNRIRSAHVLEHTWDDWDEVLERLDRMQRVMGDGRWDDHAGYRRDWRY